MLLMARNNKNQPADIIKIYEMTCWNPQADTKLRNWLLIKIYNFLYLKKKVYNCL